MTAPEADGAATTAAGGFEDPAVQAELDRALTARPWTVERARGDAAAFHGRDLPERAERLLWLFEVERPALVLGSAQRRTAEAGPDPVDAALAAALGIEVVQRRSGGAAVLLEVGRIVWADVIVPRDDPLWVDDVGRATWWVGRWWQRALAGLGLASAGGDVHRGPMRRSEHSAAICFAGVGPGELLVGGRKLVGVSQRRTRVAARFQTAALLSWEPDLLARLCRVSDAAGRAPEPVRRAALGLTELPGGAGLDVAAVHAALIDALR